MAIREEGMHWLLLIDLFIVNKVIFVTNLRENVKWNGVESLWSDCPNKELCVIQWSLFPFILCIQCQIFPFLSSWITHLSILRFFLCPQFRLSFLGPEQSWQSAEGEADLKATGKCIHSERKPYGAAIFRLHHLKIHMEDNISILLTCKIPCTMQNY